MELKEGDLVRFIKPGANSGHPVRFGAVGQIGIVRPIRSKSYVDVTPLRWLPGQIKDDGFSSKGYLPNIDVTHLEKL